MHQCWCIRELVDRIAVLLMPRYDGPLQILGSMEGVSDVNALARTCRAVQDAALDVLWYRQSSLIPLLQCLPSDLWCMRTVEEGPHPAPRLLNSPPRAQFVSISFVSVSAMLTMSVV